MQKLFEKNIKYFYKNLPHLYKLITNIKQRRFKIINDNIYDTKTNQFIYHNSITLDSKLLSINPLNNELYEKKFFQIDPFLWDEEEFFITGKIINKMIKKAKITERFFFDKDFLPSTAIFGLLAGKHIQNLVEKYYFHSLFIYEPNPEFFAISLYFIDYEKLYKKLNDRFFLWVNGKIDYFAIEKFYYERVITSTFLQLSLTTYSHPLIEDAKQKFKEVSLSKLRGWGSYEDEKKGIINHLKNINKYPLLSSSKNLNVPFCVVANGKSLEKNIEFIKKNKDSMIIVSVGTALKPLMKAGIESDFHIEQERIPTLIDALKDVLPNYNGYFIGASVVREEIFKMAKKPLMYIREGFSLDKFYPILIGSSPIVGNSGFAFSSYFSNEIYLCGMDLGWKKGKPKHASGSFYDNLDDTEKDGIKIEGNFSDDIYTNSLFLSSKRKIEELISLLNLRVYNLSDGAKIKNTIPIKDKTLKKINKKYYISQILNSFTNKKFPTPTLKADNFLNAISTIIDKKVNNYKELTGLIDFIEDKIKYSDKKELNTLLKGSIFHILNNFYFLSHKVEDFKEIRKLQKIIKKDIFQFDKDLKNLFNSSKE